MSDKIRELAEKLTDETPEEKERILRAELEPLLDAGQALLKSEWKLSIDGTPYHCIGAKELDNVRAELQNWTARNPDGR